MGVRCSSKEGGGHRLVREATNNNHLKDHLKDHLKGNTDRVTKAVDPTLSTVPAVEADLRLINEEDREKTHNRSIDR